MRPEKVKDKAGKAKIRKSSKDANKSMMSDESPELLQFTNRIICGDSGETLIRLPDACIDLIVTSPPYNFGHNYAQDPHDDTHKWDEYFENLLVVWKECERVLKPGGIFICALS